MSHSILEVSDLTMRFGGLLAVNGVGLTIKQGQIVSMIGPNGAGKTTVFNCLTGFYQPTSGKIVFAGEEIQGLPGYKIARKGMIRTFQLTKALSLLTVLDNMRLGSQTQRGESLLAALIKPLWKKREVEITAQADDLLKRFKLDAKREDYAASLSGGQRKLLEMARALMVSQS